MNENSQAVTSFRGLALPEPAVPAGYAALIAAHDLEAPLPRRLHGIGRSHRVVEAGGWRLLTPRHAPKPTLAGQLTFALKWEGLDLGVLARLFERVGAEAIEAIVRAQPTGGYARRIWFLYEWLTGERLALSDAGAGRYVDALDTRHQLGGTPTRSPRHRVRDNLPGTPAFCPLVSRTPAITGYLERDLAARAREAVARIPSDVMARAAAFLLLEDSRSSFAIEGEQPAVDRIARWGQAIGQAGRHPLSLDELLRLQAVLIGDARFVRLGLREAGGFVGQRDRRTGTPIPEHVSARPEDLADLLAGLVAFAEDYAQHLDPVVAAACVSFGFVYIHPLEDGNGRLHRYLVHHTLAEQAFNPPQLVFPVSAVMLREIEAYRKTLETHSRAILPLIDWHPTPDMNVRVENDTAAYYRYFDATPHAEFLYHCVEETIEHDLPKEARFLTAYDRFAADVQRIADMPAGTLDLLVRFLRQGEGRLSRRAREGEFGRLTEEEVARVEEAFAEAFEGVD